MTNKLEDALRVRLDKQGRLVISVGINRLNGNDAHPTIPELQIKSPTMWGDDIKTELEREDEQGASPLTRLFDDAIQNALDNGSFAINDKAYDRAMRLRRPKNNLSGRLPVPYTADRKVVTIHSEPIVIERWPTNPNYPQITYTTATVDPFQPIWR